MTTLLTWRNPLGVLHYCNARCHNASTPPDRCRCICHGAFHGLRVNRLTSTRPLDHAPQILQHPEARALRQGGRLDAPAAAMTKTA